MADDYSEDEAFQAEIAEREAFEAHFPPEAFEPIADALRVSPTAENISALRGSLMPYLEQSFSGNVVKAATIPERKQGLRELQDALAVVERASRRRRGAASLPWTVGDLNDGVPEKFVAAVQRLHRKVDERLHELEAAPARRGPKPKTMFRDFALDDLVWVYERLTGKKAGKPHWLNDSGSYGGEFYRFAAAVWGCVRERLPKFGDILPESEGALAQQLQEHWPKEEDSSTG